MENEKYICVICGQEWGVKNPFTNTCENPKCKGFCTWGLELGNPLSFTITDGQYWKTNIPNDETTD